MVLIRVGNTFPYECEDEERLIKVLKKNGIQPVPKKSNIKYSLVAYTVLIIISESAWWLNFRILENIMKEFPKLFKKHE